MKVELLKVFGDDEMVVDVARASYDKVAEMYTEDENDRLISYLARNNHWSPFSHPKVQYRLQIPIYVERQIVKTQAGVEYNSISGRYVDFSDTYTLVREWRTQSKSSKQGSAEPLDIYGQEACNIIEYSVKEFCQNAYKQLINLGVSKEQARTILPLNLNTTLIWTGSLYSFIRLCKQRLKPDAQIETKEVVEEMLRQVKKKGVFNESLKVYEL